MSFCKSQSNCWLFPITWFSVIAAIKEVDIKIPVVVRLEGNNADIGAKILSKANIKIDSINNLSDAAKRSVELAK